MTRDTLIIGGGIIGLTAAHHLCAAGLRVTVVDQSEPGRAASWAGAGILPPGDPEFAATPTDLLRSISTSRFADYSRQLETVTGIDNGYWKCGGYEYLGDKDYEYPLMWKSQNIEFTDLSYYYKTHVCHVWGFAQVRNPRHLRALIAACDRSGCEIRGNASAVGFVFDNGRVTGVRLASGEVLRADKYIIAAGAWAGPLLRQLRVTIPVTPVRGQMVLLRNKMGRRDPVMLVGRRYIVPRGDGLILVGSTEEDAGFDATTTPGGIGGLLDFAQSFMGNLRDADVEATWAGLRPSSPDGRPTIGFAPGFDNVILAVGHFRAGIQQSIGTALLVKNLVVGEVPVIPIGPFAADRKIGPADASAFRS